MSALLEPVVNGEQPSPLQAFAGTIHRSRTSPLYTAGLALVAFAMVLLPLIYLGLIALTAWLMVLHLTHDSWILTGGHGGRSAIGRALMYFGPVVAGGILITFMVKPLFAAKAKAPDPVTLDPEKEPLLFAFVRQICALVGAPVPSRINVDCQVNASAGLRRGLLSRQLELNIGLPLVAGLDMRQFAGVLAHEFGHFAQGAGMRLTYIIRHINMWFARVVYQRDKWDVSLDRVAKSVDIRIGIVLHVARGCVWLTRRILWALMHVGNAISCFMVRQMEFDADSYEAQIAGSDAFESTSKRLVLLNVGMHGAQADVEQSWTSKRLPQDLPRLVGHKAATLTPDVLQKIEESRAAENTKWFHTHPCDGDRVRHARALNEPGIFRLEEPAAGLFADFAALSKTVTCHQYKHELELEFTEENLLSTEEMLRESQANEEAQAMIRKYFGEVGIEILPLFTSGELPPLPPTATSMDNWRTARDQTEALREAAVTISAAVRKDYERLTELRMAEALGRAGFQIEPGKFGLTGSAASIGPAIVQHYRTVLTRQSELEPFMSALRARVTLALQFRAMSLARPDEDVPQLLRVLAAVGLEWRQMPELGSRLPSFMILVENIQNHSEPAKVQQVFNEIARQLQAQVGDMQARLSHVPYPFPHARGALTVAEYARYEAKQEDGLLLAVQNARTHLDRLPALYFRVLGKLLAYVDAWEREQQS